MPVRSFFFFFTLALFCIYIIAAARPQTQPTAEQYKQWQQMYGQTAQAQTAWAQQQQFMASYYR